MSKHINIVTHEIPWPAGYGGLIDIYYKMVWLHRSGYKIHLHCFTETEKPLDALNNICASVNIYARKTGWKNVSFSLPYIVSSRRSTALKKALLRNDYPILFEGIHTTHLLNDKAFSNRKCFVRLFNVETKYYASLAAAENNFFKKTYYSIESFLLKKYENKIANKAAFWALSTKDEKYYIKEFNASDVRFLPVFIAHDEVSSKTGKGNYCLYHGNLSVSENIEMVKWLVENVFSKLDVPFYIAGRSPSAEVKKLAETQANIRLVANPDDAALHELIRNAQVNVLPSLNNTGVKLKLINAMFLGRYCLVNDAGVAGSGLEQACVIAETENDFIKQVQSLMNILFDETDIEKRKQLLAALYNNELNAGKLSAWLP